MKRILAIGAASLAVLAPCVASAQKCEQTSELEFEQHGDGGTIYHVNDQNRDEAISEATQYCEAHGRTVQIRYETAGSETTMVFVCTLPR
jgi:hypothetical protein